MAVPAGLGFGYARALRREIIFRNRRLVKAHALSATSSYGQDQVVVYSCSEDGATHGNFFCETYAEIRKRPEWRKRLAKPHTGRRHLPRNESSKWRELDSCTSSDALLMNIFCHPRTLAEGKLHRLMTVDAPSQPEFGIRVAASLSNGHRDRTEVDMRLGNVLVEAKLTESDFQTCRPELAERYRDFAQIFNPAKLPQSESGYAAYQLIRSVLAAHASAASFCLIADARRPDLREQYFRVMESIRDYEMRLRCQMLTWQEIATVLSDPLRTWLGEKYGIFAPGTEPQLDASEWYW